MARRAFVLLAAILVPTTAGAQVPGAPSPGIRVAPQRPARDQAPPETGTARIRGRIVAADDGRPIRRAMVSISSTGMREPRSTATDADGRYEIAELPAGRYSISVMKPGFVTVSYGQRRPNEMGRPIDLADGQSADRIDLALPRGAVITGRVVDEYGDPVANASVSALQFRFVNGERQLMGYGPGTFQTPDTGEFRLWGLAPGEYVVQARPNTAGPRQSDNASGYPPTFHPATTAATEAQLIRLEIGQTVAGVDVVLSPIRTARLSGTTIDAEGQPVRSGNVSAMQRSASMVMAAGFAQIRPDGTFSISGVTPGSYQLRATLPRAGNALPMILTADVTVTGDDVSGIVLAPVRPVTIAGRITFDPPAHSLTPAMIRVNAFPRGNGMMMPPNPVDPPVVADDFGFEMRAAPGVQNISAVVAGTEWSVKAVMVDGRNVMDTGLEVVAGRNVADVEIVLTNRVQVLSGTVTDTRGAIAADATVFVFSQDREHWSGLGRHGGIARPDQNGRYTIRGIRPGDYYAVALEYVDDNRRGDRAYYEELVPDAVRVSLGEGETKALDLKLIRQ
jgi:protocatechuate 3,4-dioxygenase beta subunit